MSRSFRVRGGSIPAGYVLGRTAGPRGSVGLVPASAVVAAGALGTSGVAGGASGSSVSGGSTALSSVDLDTFGSTQGDILYRNATVWTVLAPGTTHQFLKTGGAAANPSWAQPAVADLSDGSTGTGTVVLNGSPVMTGFLTVPQIIGGTAANSSLTLDSTTNGAPSGDFININASSVLFQGLHSSGGNISLSGSTSGSITIKVPAAAGSNTITLPAGTTDFSATGGTHKFLAQSTAGAAITVVQPAFTDISGSVAASQLPNPSASTLGGIESYAAVSHQWINAISTSGVPSSTQPATSDLSCEASNGSASAGQIGEYISSSVLQGSAVSLTTATPANITSISLTAGDWDVRAVGCTANGANNLNNVAYGISTTSATQPTFAAENNTSNANLGTGTMSGIRLAVGPMRLSLSGTTTVYLVVTATFASGSCSGFGFLAARRMR